MKLNSPSFLKPGDQVAFLATAKQFEEPELEYALDLIKSWGLVVKRGANIYKKHGMFAGSDEQRCADLQAAVNDPAIKAIFCVRGGYGTSRFIDQISFKSLKTNPKWIIGFSDITILLSELQQKKHLCIHGPMPLTFHKPGSDLAIASMHAFLMEGKWPSITTAGHPKNKKGIGSGKLTGGNLTILCSAIGTKSDLSWKNKILFIEEICEPLYKVDRMMVQLKRSGKLEKLAGLVVGQMTDMEDGPVLFGKSIEEIILDAVAEYKFPVCFDFPAGHEGLNQPLIMGAPATLRVGPKKTILQYDSPSK